MLKSLLLENWKSFGEGAGARNELQLGPVTLLVGPNASGKSNALDALRFLQGAALDLPLADVLRGRSEGQRQVWPAIRGHVVEAARFGTTQFRLVDRWDFMNLCHDLTVSTEGDVTVEKESLYSPPHGYFFDTHAQAPRGDVGRGSDGALRVAWGGARNGDSLTDTASSLRSILGQAVQKDRVPYDVIAHCRWLSDALRSAVFLDIHPSAMRDYRPLNGGQLGVSGENISPVLASLSSERLQDVVDWLQELASPKLDRIDFDRTQLREVMMFLVESTGAKISARSMSDGTLRFLGELVALLTCPEETLVVFEEPDVGLHPSRIHLFAELLEHVAKQRKIQILATTHSPVLLAHLKPETLGDVIAFGRAPETGWTVCSRLRDLPHFETLKGAKDLEHLISTGWLERAL